MSKILFIGVGGTGRRIVRNLKEAGISDTDFISFGTFDGDYKKKDIPHYNLVTMNGYSSIPSTNDPRVFRQLAENVEDDIKEILECYFNKSGNEK